MFVADLGSGFLVSLWNLACLIVVVDCWFAGNVWAFFRGLCFFSAFSFAFAISLPRGGLLFDIFSRKNKKRIYSVFLFIVFILKSLISCSSYSFLSLLSWQHL